MPITVTERLPHSSQVTSEAVVFRGRVVRVEHTVEDRNHSDTWDYTDYRSTNCVWALVWLGGVGVPPVMRGDRMLTSLYDITHKIGEERELEDHEKFGWIDCTNMWGWKGSPELLPQVDGLDMQLLLGGPEMLDDLERWDAAMERILEEKKREEEAREAERSARIQAENERKEKRAVKKAAKEAHLKEAAEGLLARIPLKGTEVTVDGFTGKVFWVGVSKYYGKYSARAGVKDTKGNVVWVDAEKFTGV